MQERSIETLIQQKKIKMKRNSLNLWATLMVVALFFSFAMSGCKKDDDDVKLEPIDGYNNSNEVANANLMAYWDFDGNQNETKSGTAATSSDRVSYVPGIKGQAVKFDSGYIFYNSIPALNGMTAWSVSCWVQTQNSQEPGYTSMLFQLTKPGSTFGNINLGVETGGRPAGNDTLTYHGWFSDGGGLQDNRNDPFGTPPVGVVKAGPSDWVNVVMTYEKTDPTSLMIYANGTSIGAYSERGNSEYTPMTPSSVVIGAWLNNVPEQTHTGDTWPHAFVGSIDQMRVYNKSLTAAEISALYKLESAGR